MKNYLLILIIILSPVFGFSQSTEQKSVVIINDTISYLFQQNQKLITGVNNYKIRSKKGLNQLIIGSLLMLSSPTVILMRQNTDFFYLMLATGFSLNVSGSITLYKSYKHLDFN